MDNKLDDGVSMTISFYYPRCNFLFIMLKCLIIICYRTRSAPFLLRKEKSQKKHKFSFCSQFSSVVDWDGGGVEIRYFTIKSVKLLKLTRNWVKWMIIWAINRLKFVGHPSDNGGPCFFHFSQTNFPPEFP